MPPPGLAGLPGQLDQPVPFGPGHAVQLEKDPNVAGLGAAPPGLDAEQGRSRPLQLPRHLFPAHPGGLATALEFHGQAAAAQRRVLSWVTTSGHTGTLHLALVCLHYCKTSSVGALWH